ncbi:unnamed protein product, partial [Polarella glacialis]
PTWGKFFAGAMGQVIGDMAECPTEPLVPVPKPSWRTRGEAPTVSDPSLSEADEGRGGKRKGPPSPARRSLSPSPSSPKRSSSSPPPKVLRGPENSSVSPQRRGRSVSAPTH